MTLDSKISAQERQGNAYILGGNLLFNNQGSSLTLGSNEDIKADENISITSTSNSPTSLQNEITTDAGGDIDIKAEKTAPTNNVISNVKFDDGKGDLSSSIGSTIVKNILSGSTKRSNEKNSNDNQTSEDAVGSVDKGYLIKINEQKPINDVTICRNECQYDGNLSSSILQRYLLFDG